MFSWARIRIVLDQYVVEVVSVAKPSQAGCLQIEKMKAIIAGGLHLLRRDEKELDINITVDIFLQCNLNYRLAAVFNKHKTRPMGSNELLKANNS